jgi:hypothetical protein
LNSFDYNDQNGGTSFKDRHENWMQNPLVDDFLKWGAESFGRKLILSQGDFLMHILGISAIDGSDDESTRKKKNPEIKLKRDKDGYPMLPSLEEINHHGLLYKKRLIGKFMGDMYGA